MPTSHPRQVNEIVELIRRLDPQRILDVGCGFGKFGFLAREYLDVWGGEHAYGAWTRTIDAIEGFSRYLTPVHDFVYDRVLVGNACDILPQLDARYDLVLLIDILEHFERADGLAILRRCVELSANTIVSTPKDIGDQEDVFENELEAHRSQWRYRDFDEFPNRGFLANRDSIICCYGEDARRAVRKARWRLMRHAVHDLWGNLKFTVLR
ncbi:MAG: class I SAM-dependent methyltransferase [Alphaproteobacteria bacterium]|nr:MAG: class I SAM-dependent methyltransferase [Alphaproteobacteria bacterium]